MPDATDFEPFGGARSFDRHLRPLLARCQFPAAGSAVRCAVSGGPDSMALLALAVGAGLQVEAIHVDHGLRPEGSAEAAIVAAAADRFGTRFDARSVTIAPGGDLEARARSARQAALGPGALTGHTADDQAETLLVNLLRGAGPDGLAAMRPGGSHPILGLRRTETHRLCSALQLDVVRDPSNNDPRFVRNRIRNELIPLIDDIAGRDVTALLNRTSEQARVLTDWVEAAADGVDPTDTRALADAPVVVAAAALRRWLRTDDGHPPSAAELGRVMAVVRHDAVGCELSGRRRVRRTDGVLRIE